MKASCGPHCSMMHPSFLSNGYLRIAHWHVGAWSIMSLHMGAWCLKDSCWVCNMSSKLVSMLLLESFKQSSGVLVVGFNILLWMTLALRLSIVR